MNTESTTHEFEVGVEVGNWGGNAHHSGTEMTPVFGNQVYGTQ